MKVYADNAATTKMSRAAVDAMLPYMDTDYGNPSSLHTLGQKTARALVKARETMAKYLGCEAREILFTSGGSEADNQAIISAAALGDEKGKRHIISTSIEHHAVLNTLKKLQKQGYRVTLLDVDTSGIVTPSQIADSICDDTCLVTIMFANNEIGSIQPISEIGRICRERGVLFHTDAVQAAGHLNISVAEQNIDMLSISAHKFCGPKGIGALYAKKGIALKSLIEGGSQERGSRAGTENIPAIMGMAAAFEEACLNIDENEKKVSAMRDKIIDGLLKIPGSMLNGDRYRRLPGNINMSFEGIDGESLLLLLDMKGVYASTGSACASGAPNPSHVLLAIGRSEEIARGSLRLTICENNTEEEVDHIIKEVTATVEQLRKKADK